jgi:hypothetical protein
LTIIVFLTIENIPKNCGSEKCMSVAHSIPPMVMAIEGIWMNICQPPPATMAVIMTIKPRSIPIIVAISTGLISFNYLF